MKKISTLLFLLLSHFCFSQNLVPNWSFEDTVACPTGPAQIDNALGWTIYRSSPDYFNACNATTVGVPSNIIGFQYAKNGNAYAGIATFQTTGLYREYLGATLSQALSIGQKYFVSFYAHRPTGDNHFIATNKIGVHLSTIAYSNSNQEPIHNYAQVFTDSIIVDTLNWVKISGSFIADSDYQYISIGNFFNDSLTSINSSGATTISAYYFIDDIYLSSDSISAVVIEQNNNFLIKEYPNPARDWIVLEGSEVFSFSIFDALGRVCIENTSTLTSLLKINVSALSRGIYFIQIKSLKQSFIKKIILQ